MVVDGEAAFIISFQFKVILSTFIVQWVKRLVYVSVDVVCFSLNQNRRTYFYSGFVAYFLGLVATIFVMHCFKHAQVSIVIGYVMFCNIYLVYCKNLCQMSLLLQNEHYEGLWNCDICLRLHSLAFTFLFDCLILPVNVNCELLKVRQIIIIT